MFGFVRLKPGALRGESDRIMTTISQMNASTVRKGIAIAVSLGLVIAAAVAPETPGLTLAGREVLSILIAGIIMWATEALPLPATALAVLIAMPIVGVCTFDEAYTHTVNSTVFFLMGTFAFTVVLDATTIPTRIANAVLHWSGTSSNKMMLGFMAATATLSMFMSDVAACGVFISVAKKLLVLNKAEKGTSQLGKALMIAIPWASFAGGCAVMTGNGCNVVTAGLFKTLFGFEITFVQWAMLGTPIALVLLIACWLILTRWFKPEDISIESIEQTQAETAQLGKLQAPEIKTVVVIILAMVFWVLSSWFPVINTAEVAIIAIVLFSIPGWSCLEFKELITRMNWGVILMIMCIISVSHFIVSTGAGDWVVNTIVGSLPDSAKVPLVLVLIMSIIGAVAHNVVPVGPAVAGMIAYPFGAICGEFGICMELAVMLVAFQASFAFMLPLDCVPILTYSAGYYKMTDMIKVGWMPTLVNIVLNVTLLPALCMLFGYM